MNAYPIEDGLITAIVSALRLRQAESGTIKLGELKALIQQQASSQSARSMTTDRQTAFVEALVGTLKNEDLFARLRGGKDNTFQGEWRQKKSLSDWIGKYWGTVAQT